MKKLSILVLSLAFVLTSTAFRDAALVYSVDPTSSELRWTGYHLAKSYEHYGFVKLKSGKIALKKGVITSGEFVIDMTTLTSADVEDAGRNAKLVGHLKSADFFDVTNNPEAKLVITKSIPLGNGILRTTGDLTIRGITKTIEFETRLKESKNSIEAIADLKIARTDFNVMYGWNIENAMLSGEFRIQVKLVASK